MKNKKSKAKNKPTKESEGLSFNSWFLQLIDLAKDRNIHVHSIDEDIIRSYYETDCTVEDALNKL